MHGGRMTAMANPIPSLILLRRDPAAWPSPHTAEVPAGSVPEWCAARQGWTVADQQPVHAGRVVELSAAELSAGGPVAVLCPGPSLTVTWPKRRRDYAATVAVNRAAFAYPVDWWCGLDDIWQKWGRPDPYPRIGLVGAVRGLTGAASALLPRDGLALVHRNAPAGCPEFSMLAAIGFAFENLRATAVDVYGCDMAGAADFDGRVEKENNRTDQRWQEERAGLMVLAQQYDKRLRVIQPKAAKP
jgi:hypothetical protein